VRVRRSNLVVANAVNLGADRLKQLVDHIGSKLGSPELRERLFKTLWDNLQYVGELGSLVQVREGVGQVLDDWVDTRAKERGLTKLIHRKSAPGLLVDLADPPLPSVLGGLAHDGVPCSEQGRPSPRNEERGALCLS
jgi:hypothetical protein